MNEWNRRQTARRGGGQTMLSLEEWGAEARYQSEPADEATPDRLFERRWASALLDQIRRGLEQEYAAAGKAHLFENLRSSLTGAVPSIPYDALGRQLGLSAGAVKMAVHRLRQRYGELLRQEIAQTVARPEDIEAEIRCLIAATGS